MQTINNNLQLTNKRLEIIKFSLLFAFALHMLVGSSVGSWQVTLAALHSLVPILPADVAALTEHRCGAKLYWCIILRLWFYRYRDSLKMLTVLLVI